MELDLTPALLGEHNVTIKRGVLTSFVINMYFDAPVGENMIRVQVVDSATGNDAYRNTSDGIEVNNDTVKLNIKHIYNLLPGMIEEVVVMNKFMGSKK